LHKNIYYLENKLYPGTFKIRVGVQMREMWDERYSESGFAYGEEPNEFVKEMANSIPPNKEVLCLGAGEGRNAVYLATLGHSVHALDLSKVGAKKTKELAEKYQCSVTYTVADLETFDLGKERWDYIISIFCHTDPVWRNDLFGRIINSLRRNGTFILEGYSKEQIHNDTGGTKEQSWLVSISELEDAFNTLKIEKLEQVEIDLHEGKYHHGTSSVVHLIARR